MDNSPRVLDSNTSNFVLPVPEQALYISAVAVEWQEEQNNRDSSKDTENTYRDSTDIPSMGPTILVLSRYFPHKSTAAHDNIEIRDNIPVRDENIAVQDGIETRDNVQVRDESYLICNGFYLCLRTLAAYLR
ncbi:MAG: hypothetical protein AVO38_06645 [delta proteobacterium ML8_D]|nr:MAG: hypothetical protein AVO38_06645 [delta proteobacterium ML8_D]